MAAAARYLIRLVPHLWAIALTCIMILPPRSATHTAVSVEAVQFTIQSAYAEMRVGIDPSAPPFAAFSGESVVGFDVDLARALGALYGVPVRFVYLGYDGLYDALLTGQVDLLIASLTPDTNRLNRVIFTPPYFDAGIVLIAPVERMIRSMADVDGKQLAYAFGSNAHSEANLWSRRLRTFQPMPYESAQYALDAVRLGFADAALVDAVSGRMYARQHPAWLHHTQSVYALPYVIAVDADQVGLAAAVTAALERFQADGTLDALLHRWL
ncbi:MAG: ABC transporter substrate-binding protein [bacterium]|nr:ABC transporter substrate-binding protein [bacterium]